MSRLDDFNRASGNKPAARWGEPFQDFETNRRQTLERWTQDFDQDRRSWSRLDWFIAAAAIVALTLVLACSRGSVTQPEVTTEPPKPGAALFEPREWPAECAGFTPWGDAWCECVWAADSTLFQAASRCGTP
jgi:hypothetical protein